MDWISDLWRDSCLGDQAFWKSSTFWLTDGRVIRGPATRRQPVYDARVTDGMVEVRPHTERTE